MDWYLLSILSAVFFGIQKFLFKVAAENNCSTKLLTFSFMLTVSILAFAIFFINQTPILNVQTLLLLALINGLIFLASSVFRLEALRIVPSTVAYPLMELSSIFIILFSIVYFKDSLNTYQTIGVVLGLAVTYLLLNRHEEEKEKYQHFHKGLWFVLGCVITSALAQILSKVVAISQLDLLFYIAISYLYNSAFILLFHSMTKRKEKMFPKLKMNKSIVYGFIIGVTNFIAFYTYLQALKPGSLSLVTILVSFSTLIPILLSIAIYKDKLTIQRTLGILLTILSLILIKQG